MTLNRLIEKHRKALLAAGDDPLRIIAANKEFWARKLGFLKEKELPVNCILFNEKKRGSYHPWSAQSMGETYGELELKEFISPKDYLDLPPAMDEFIHGIVIGTETARLRKSAKGKGKDPIDNLSKELANTIDKGKV